jgi:hypothetical protein
VCQRLISAGERSGLLTRIATTESVLLRRPMERAVCIHLLSEPVLTIIAATESGADEKLTAFLQLESATRLSI